MKKMRAIVFIIVIVLSFGLLAGCRGKGGTTSQAGTGISGDLEIAVFSNGDLMDNFWNYAVDEFRRLYPNVKATLNASPKIEESIRPRFVSGNPPDLYYMGGWATADENQLTQEGHFMDLTDFFNSADAIGYDVKFKDTFAVQANNTKDGRLYGIGIDYYVWGAYYNKGMARQYGWEPPTNWQEFLELAPKIKAAGIYPIIHQGKYPDYLGYGFMQSSIAANGGRQLLVNMANLNKGAYLDPVVLDAYRKYELLRDNDYLPASALSLTHTEAQMEWLQGRSFIIPCGNWLEGEMANDIPRGFEMGFIPSFWNDAGKTPIFVTSTAHISISEKAKNPDAAKEFLRVLFSKNVVLAHLDMQSGISVIKEEYAGKELIPSTRDIQEWVNAGKVQVISAVGGTGGFEPYPEQRAVINNNIAAILGRQVTAVEALAAIEAECQRILNDDSIAKVEIR